MRGLFCLGALAAVVSAAVVNATEAFDENTTLESMEMSRVYNEAPFFFYMMTDDSNDLNRIKEELNSKLALAKQETRDTAVDDSLEMLRTCYSKASLMDKYVVLRPKPQKKAEVASMSSSLSQAEGRDLDWGIFQFTFGTGGNRLSFGEDLAWAVKNVVDIYDKTPLCKDEVSKREGRLTRWARKIVRGKWTRREFVENLLGLALHKALFDWSRQHDVPDIFTGEDIPSLVTTAREANANASKLKRLDNKLKSQKYLDSKIRGLRAVVSSQYLSHVGRAHELMEMGLWQGRDQPGSETSTEPGTPSGTVMESEGQFSDLESGAKEGGATEDVREPKGGASNYFPEPDPAALVATRALVSSRVFMILTRSKFTRVSKLINETARGIGDDVLGNRHFGHAIVPTLPCPSKDKKLVDADGDTFSILRRSVWVLKFHGLDRGSVNVKSRNAEAEAALTEVLEGKDEKFLTDLFGTEVAHRPVGERIVGLFPTMCFKNLKQARTHLGFLVSEDNIKSVLTEVPLWNMKKYAKTMQKLARTDKEKIKKDVKIKVGKMVHLKSFLWGLLKTTGIIFAVGFSMVLLVCMIAVSAMVSPVGGIPACLAAAVMFGGPMWFVVTSALSLGAVGLGGFAFAYSAVSSIESALRFVIGPIIEAKRRELQTRRAELEAPDGMDMEFDTRF